MFLAHFLRLESSIKILAGHCALRPCHVTPDNEVRGAEIFPDDHVLDRFARPSHLHGVGKVCPTESIASPLLVKWLLLHDFISLDTSFAVDVSWLRRANSRVHEDDGILHIFFCVEQELEVRLVNRVAVLEGHNWLACWQGFAHLGWRLESVAHATPNIVETCHQAMNLSTHIVL